MTSDIPDWLVPGAEVVIFTQGGGRRDVVRTTVAKVATKSFTVTAENEPRFRLPSCSAVSGGAWSTSERFVVPADSERGTRELRGLVRRRKIADARSAIDKWIHVDSSDTRSAVIAVMQALETSDDHG